MTTMTFEAALARVADAVDGGRLCWRCGLGHGDLHPANARHVSGLVEHVADPACVRVRGLLVRVRDQLAAIHKAAL